MIKLRGGMRVSCRIHGEVIDDAKLQTENGKFFICQNRRDGERCEDKLGYKYSWGFYNGSTSELAVMNITNLKVIGQDIEDAQEGDIITNGETKRTVLGRAGKIMFVSDIHNTTVYGYASSVGSFKLNEWTIQIEDDGMVEIVVDGVTKRISKTSAKALNLID